MSERMVTLEIELPVTLAKQAEQEGLLSSEALASLLMTELARKRGSADRLIHNLERLHAAKGDLSLDQIAEEIDAFRAEADDTHSPSHS